MMLHVAAQNWYILDVRSFEWQIVNFYDSAPVRWAVPVFVMISGALFLNPSKDIPLKKIYSKYILRIVAALVFWSFVYTARDYMRDGNIKSAAASFVKGHYHLWFLFMIIGLYMIVPFVRRIAESEPLTKYFLLLVLIFTSILPECAEIISLFSDKLGSFADQYINKLYIYFVMGFTGYFLLGHFLNQTQITPRMESIIYLAGLCGVAMTILLSVSASLITGEPNGTFYSGLRMNINTVCESVAVFVFFKQHLNRENKFIRRLSQYSFGAYLIHDAALSLLRKLGLHSLAFTPLLAIPLTAAAAFIISFAVSAVINHIPVLKKYIV